MYQKTRRNSLGQFKRGRQRMIHVSAAIIANPHATNAGNALIVGPGTTRNVGSNKVKLLLRKVVSF